MPSPKQTGVVVDPGCLVHDMGRHHPETPKRLQVLLDLMTSSDALSLGLAMTDGRRATQGEVRRVHGDALLWLRSAICSWSGYRETPLHESEFVTGAAGRRPGASHDSC